MAGFIRRWMEKRAEKKIERAMQVCLKSDSYSQYLNSYNTHYLKNASVAAKRAQNARSGISAIRKQIGEMEAVLSNTKCGTDDYIQLSKSLMKADRLEAEYLSDLNRSNVRYSSNLCFSRNFEELKQGFDNVASTMGSVLQYYMLRHPEAFAKCTCKYTSAYGSGNWRIIQDAIQNYSTPGFMQSLSGPLWWLKSSIADNGMQGMYSAVDPVQKPAHSEKESPIPPASQNEQNAYQDLAAYETHTETDEGISKPSRHPNLDNRLKDDGPHKSVSGPDSKSGPYTSFYSLLGMIDNKISPLEDKTASIYPDYVSYTSPKNVSSAASSVGSGTQSLDSLMANLYSNSTKPSAPGSTQILDRINSINNRVYVLEERIRLEERMKSIEERITGLERMYAFS
jgi:hypothetical protein